MGTIIIFVLVLLALILVHEFGHFVVAKLVGMRVDEFGLGFPPRAALLGKVGETEITLNWIPAGGFVKIYGEDSDAQGDRSFASKNRFLQALVLLAGIVMNLLFAYVLLSAGLALGTPRALAPDELDGATQVQLAVADVLPGSPASTSGIQPGDELYFAEDAHGSWTTGPSQAGHPETFTNFVTSSAGAPIVLTLLRGSETIHATSTPVQGLIASDPSRYALGLDIATVGVVPLSLPQALWQGAELTYGATILTAEGLWHFFAGVFTLHADLSQVAGPIGIEKVVGTASASGLGNLFSLVALISINLALINLVPFPALDGGRLLFVIIEGIIRRPIPAKVTYYFNLVGFSLIIVLFFVISAHDVFVRFAG